jgi:hypothetical protein
MFRKRRLGAFAAVIAALAVATPVASAGPVAVTDLGNPSPGCPAWYVGPTNLATGCPYWLMT